MTTNISQPKGRPRRFDPDAAVATAQNLFHERGFDGVSISDLTEAIGINPPSFYAAFGSKMGLYARILQRYQQTGAVPLNEHLRADAPVAEGLAAMLDDAAQRYAKAGDAAGCLVLEGTHARDPEARAAACERHRTALKTIHAYVATHHRESAQALTDFVNVVMSGMSDEARRGASLDRLLQVSHLAALAIAETLGRKEADTQR